MSNHWSKVSKQWSHVGPPLKPSAQELATFQDLIGTNAVRALVLGVTQEFHGLEWTVGSRVTALDHTIGMIENVWPGPRGTSICGDWTRMPLASSSQDLVLCDGGLTLLTYPLGVQQLALELHRVLESRGSLLVRLYTPPEEKEGIEDVLSALAHGELANLSDFKLRMTTAMQGEPETGTVLNDVWNALVRFAPDLDVLADSIGWPREHMRAIETYRGSALVYRFPTVSQVTKILEEAGMTCKNVRYCSGNPGDNCPVVHFQKLQ